MVKIALLGAPGCGKSTLAAYVYAMLKDDGIDGELVTEYIREHVNKHKRVPSITFQSIVYERQMEKEKILPENLDFFVTDSPHILSYIYASLYIDYNDIDQRELLSDLYAKFLANSRDSYDLVYVLAAQAVCDWKRMKSRLHYFMCPAGTRLFHFILFGPLAWRLPF